MLKSFKEKKHLYERIRHVLMHGRIDMKKRDKFENIAIKLKKELLMGNTSEFKNNRNTDGSTDGGGT